MAQDASSGPNQTEVRHAVSYGQAFLVVALVMGVV